MQYRYYAPVRERHREDRGVIDWDVSIHAPVRERLGDMDKRLEEFKVSIHAPVRERLRCWLKQSIKPGFNSRSRERATSAVEVIRDELIVSIHASIRERRQLGEVRYFTSKFQFTLI